MAFADQTRREAGLAVKFAVVGCLGLAVDMVALKLGLAVGLTPSIARLISLALAMQLTFVVNGLLVFRCLQLRALPRQWACYMGSNGVGNVCNYWIFLGLIASGLPVVSHKLVALVVGAVVAWAINFLGARLIAFGETGSLAALLDRARGRVCAPCADESLPAAKSARAAGLARR